MHIWWYMMWYVRPIPHSTTSLELIPTGESSNRRIVASALVITIYSTRKARKPRPAQSRGFSTGTSDSGPAPRGLHRHLGHHSQKGRKSLGCWDFHHLTLLTFLEWFSDHVKVSFTWVLCFTPQTANSESLRYLPNAFHSINTIVTISIQPRNMAAEVVILKVTWIHPVELPQRRKHIPK